MKKKFSLFLPIFFLSFAAFSQNNTKIFKEQKFQPPRNIFYFFGGINTGQVTYSNLEFQRVGKVITTDLITPLIGVGADFGLSKINNQWSLGTELYSKNESTKANDSGGTGTYSSNSLRFNLHIKYALLFGKIQPYIKLGAGAVYNLNSRISYNQTGGASTEIYNYNSFNTEKFIFSAIGVKKNKFFLETRFEWVRIESPLTLPGNWNETNFGLSLGYVFAGR